MSFWAVECHVAVLLLSCDEKKVERDWIAAIVWMIDPSQPRYGFRDSIPSKLECLS